MPSCLLATKDHVVKLNSRFLYQLVEIHTKNRKLPCLHPHHPTSLIHIDHDTKQASRARLSHECVFTACSAIWIMTSDTLTAQLSPNAEYPHNTMLHEIDSSRCSHSLKAPLSHSINSSMPPHVLGGTPKAPLSHSIKLSMPPHVLGGTHGTSASGASGA